MNEEAKTPGAYVAPKEWSTLNDSEKIERMREVVKNMDRRIYQNSNEFHSLQNAFEKHQHEPRTGGLVVPYNRYHSTGCGTLSVDSSSIGKFF